MKVPLNVELNVGLCVGLDGTLARMPNGMLIAWWCESSLGSWVGC